MEHQNQDTEIQKTQGTDSDKAIEQESGTPESQAASRAWDILFLITLIIVVIVCCCMLLF